MPSSQYFFWYLFNVEELTPRRAQAAFLFRKLDIVSMQQSKVCRNENPLEDLIDAI
jgi:hypothetical protein